MAKPMDLEGWRSYYEGIRVRWPQNPIRVCEIRYDTESIAYDVCSYFARQLLIKRWSIANWELEDARLNRA